MINLNISRIYIILLCNFYIHRLYLYCLNLIQGKYVYTIKLSYMGSGDNKAHQLFSDLKWAVWILPSPVVPLLETLIRSPSYKPICSIFNIFKISQNVRVRITWLGFSPLSDTPLHPTPYYMTCKPWGQTVSEHQNNNYIGSLKYPIHKSHSWK